MAGNYPDAPSWRMAYDRDGSIGVTVSPTGILGQLTSAQLQTLNNEGSTSIALTTQWETSWKLALIFPELRDVDAVFIQQGTSAAYNPVSVTVEVSEDTTNGEDGTWVALTSFTPDKAATNPAFREEIRSITALSVRGVRTVTVDGSSLSRFLPSAFHVYGERSPGQALNALELWHPSSDEKLPPAWLDWGNTPRGSSEDRTFRVKNVSTVSTAEAVRVAMDVLTDGAPSVPGQHLLSYGGGSYLAQVNVGNLAPGAISGPVTLRRVTASDAQLGLFAFRVFAESDAWS